MIVAMDELLPEQKQVLVSWGETQNVQIKELHECELRKYFEIWADYLLEWSGAVSIVEEYGKANLVEPIPATKDQLASICYTSVSAIFTSTPPLKTDLKSIGYYEQS